jgi:hypothetical protein
MTRVTIPDVALPWALQTNPHAAEAGRHMRQWTNQFGLISSPAAAERFNASGISTLAGYVHPGAKPHELNVYTDWLAWQFFVDDQHAEGRYRTTPEWQAAIAHLGPVFDTGATTQDRSSIAHALVDILSRIYPYMTTTWRRRFVNHIHDTFHAALAVNAHRESGTIATVDEYITLRRLTGCVLPCLAVDEFMAGGEIPDRVYHHLAYRNLLLATADVVVWINDLYSWPKEEANGEVGNFVFVLEHSGHLTRQQAIDSLTERIMERAHQFQCGSHELTAALDDLAVEPTSRDIINRCVKSMRKWMTATLAWSKESVRYTHIDPEASKTDA